MATLRHSIVDTINELQPLLAAGLPQEQEVQVRVRLDGLYLQLEEVLRQSIVPDGVAFSDAISVLEAATEQAEAALKDLSEVAELIEKLSDAIAKVDKIIGVGVRIV